MLIEHRDPCYFMYILMEKFSSSNDGYGYIVAALANSPPPLRPRFCPSRACPLRLIHRLRARPLRIRRRFPSHPSRTTLRVGAGWVTDGGDRTHHAC